MTRALIVLRCGRNSLHKKWLDNTVRNWDLVLCPYQEIDTGELGGAVIPGHKWDGLREYFRRSRVWRDYDYICLPDDDLATDTATFNRFFDLCAEHKVHLAAPTLTPSSYFSHPIAMQNSQFLRRQTNFVEIMAPCFSKEFFADASKTFAMSRSGTGFGLDFLWPHMLNYKDIWLFDETCVNHTRPVGQFGNAQLSALKKADAWFIHGFGIKARQKTLAGLTVDRQFITCSDPAFADRYRAGYAYLLERFPKRQWQIELSLAAPAPVSSPSVKRRVADSLKHLLQPNRTISRGRPSLVSSVSQWSCSDDPALEASGGNDGRINGMSGFHTSLEMKPWWQVDLGGQHTIGSVVVFNRLDVPNRCANLDILVSKNGQCWDLLYSKRDGIPFGGIDGNPLRLTFTPPPLARFVRVQLAGKGFLHLDQIEVFEEPISPVGLVISTIDAPQTVGEQPSPTRTIGPINELRTALFGDESPVDFADPKFVDPDYPHTNLRPAIVETILDVAKPRLWLEIGSMLGGSAIVTADVIKRLQLPTEIVCIDPFCGDVNMWDWEQGNKRAGKWQFLRLDRGRPTLFDRFLANVTHANHSDIILPIMATSTIGIRLLSRLARQGRMSSLPEVIYLDSAHEPDETLLELRMSWHILPVGGVLFGDDWSWRAVQEDVLRFVPTIRTHPERLLKRHSGAREQDGVVLMEGGQWALVK